MKAITIWPEWAWAICYLGKPVENRTWSPPKGMIGQRIAIHAGASIGGVKTEQACGNAVIKLVNMAVDSGWNLELGGPVLDVFEKNGVRVEFDARSIQKSAIVATAILAGSTEGYWCHHEGQIKSASKTMVEVTPGIECLGWQAEGQFHWLLEDVKVLDEPIPMKGKQKLWSLPAETADVLR